jgi:hypothetical protein
VKNCTPQVRQTAPPHSPNHERPSQREPQTDVLLLDHPCSDVLCSDRSLRYDQSLDCVKGQKKAKLSR